LLACIAEEHHDDRGLILPPSVAPYPVHLVQLGSPETNAGILAGQVETALRQAGLEPLYDDRNESAGVKFNDADLIGLPIRLTVSDRALQRGGVELKRRDGTESSYVAPEAVPETVQRLLKDLS
jgi:prolyl-tRNA synthetase